MPALIRELDRELLLRLLDTCTVNPLEATRAEPPARLWEAQRDYAQAAERIGLRTIHHADARPEAVLRPDVPLAVRQAAGDPDFLPRQPSLVLQLGPDLSPQSTVMFNVHLDTVSGLEPVGFDGARFTGRGAVDAKGPAVAILAGLRAALATDPSIGREVRVLVQVVAGEEGGAMGTFGTRPLVEAGFVGRLNIFCEPTSLHYLPRATASMTACVRVDGQSCIDDCPSAGHNATVLLGFLAHHFALALDSPGAQGRVCIAGLHTGDLHNRVYGSGRLLLNLSYGSPAEGALREEAVVDALNTGLREFSERFAGTREFARTAAEAAAITTVEWHKRGLPGLSGSDPALEELLEVDAGLRRWPDTQPAFTCDAIWMHGVPETFTAVVGPGALDRNNAHAAGEFAELSELDEFASVVADIVTSFARRQATLPLREKE
jgi:acetylornithine deacetylase/succinyl-diaminopimelate desuccinylase-like protein